MNNISKIESVCTPIARDATVKIKGPNSDILLKVNKDLVCSKSSIMKDLFESSPNGVEIEELETIQFAAFVESFHSPSLQDSLQSLTVLNVSHAMLACKYLMDDYVERFKQLIEFELVRLDIKSGIGIEFEVTSVTAKVNRGLYRHNVLNYPNINSIVGKYSSNEMKWIKAGAGQSDVEFYTGASGNMRVRIGQMVLKSESRVIPMGYSDWIRDGDGISYSINIARHKPFKSPPTADCRLFWEIVGAVLTHDGLKIEGKTSYVKLCDTRDLIKFLTEHKPYHLWEKHSMLQHLDIDQYTELCIDV